MKFFTTIIVLALVFLAITFSIQNTGDVAVKYFDLLNAKVSLYALIFFSFFAGVVFSGLIGLIDRMRLKRSLTKTKKDLQNVEAELYNARKAQLASESPPALKKEYLS